MDYLFDGIIIVFVISCIIFFYNALKIQHGSKNFPTPKDDSEKKENDKQIKPTWGWVNGLGQG